MRSGLSRQARLAAAAVVLALVGFVRPAAAQPEVRVGGLAYLDYYVQLASPDSARDGQHGFTYRRVYLTADARLSDAFSARLRLEASDGTVGPRGPAPFVKDLYLRWRSGGGHRLTLGVASPPAFDLVEDVWGFRALDKTLLDLNGIVASRDFGLRADGPIPLGGEGMLRYSVMVGNNEGVFPEDDKHKRAYAQLQVRPAEPVVLAVGGSLASFADEREAEHLLFGLAAYDTDAWRLGAEGYVRTLGFEDTDDALQGAGVGVWAAVAVAEGVEVTGRFDRSRQEAFAETPSPDPTVTAYRSFGLLGVAYAPIPQVRLIPNLRLARTDGDAASDLQARFTVDVSF